MKKLLSFYIQQYQSEIDIKLNEKLISKNMHYALSKISKGFDIDYRTTYINYKKRVEHEFNEYILKKRLYRFKKLALLIRQKIPDKNIIPIAKAMGSDLGSKFLQYVELCQERDNIKLSLNVISRIGLTIILDREIITIHEFIKKLTRPPKPKYKQYRSKNGRYRTNKVLKWPYSNLFKKASNLTG